jgi:FemAB-related protein (PEP-CTERM system-associated)
VDVVVYGGERAAWDAFVQSQPGWTHFHQWGWKAVIEDVFGHECVYLGAYENGLLQGVLPLVWVRSRLFGSYLVSMPFVNYGGPLGTPAAVAALADDAVRRAGEHRGTMLELRSRRPLDILLEAAHRKVTVLLDLEPGNPDAAWDSLRAKVRNQVRRPRNEGVEVRFGPEQVSGFYSVFSRHMRDLGTPVQPRRLFERIAETFGDDVWFGCAYLGQRPIAAGCGVRWGGELEMTWAASLRDYNRIAPNMLLYWSFMERCAQLGMDRFNFGRCTPGGGTHRFKRQWGGRDEKLWWYSAPTGGRSSTPSPEDSNWSWGPGIWRRLPVGLTRWLGPLVVKNTTLAGCVGQRLQDGPHR